MYHTIVRRIYAVASLRWLKFLLVMKQGGWRRIRTWSSHCDPYPSWVHRMPSLCREYTSLGSQGTRTRRIVRTRLWIVGDVIDLQECRCSRWSPLPCWHRYMRSHQQSQSFVQRDRASWDQSCLPRLHLGCGIVRNESWIGWHPSLRLLLMLC